MKNTIPQKIPVLFSRPKKIPASFIDPKKSLLAKMSDPKNYSDPPVIKICEWGPWGKIKQLTMEIERLSAKINSFQAKVFSLDRFITSDKDLFYFTGLPKAQPKIGILLSDFEARTHSKLTLSVRSYFTVIEKINFVSRVCILYFKFLI